MAKIPQEAASGLANLETGCLNWALDLAGRSKGRFRVDDLKNLDDQSLEAKDQRKYRDLEIFFHESELVRHAGIGNQSLERSHNDNLLWLTNEASASFTPGSFKDAIEQLKSKTDLIQDIKESVAARQNIVLLTNHASLSSPFMEELGLASAISNAKIAMRMGITVSPTLGWLDAQVKKHPATRQPGYMNTIKIGTKMFNTWKAIPQESENAIKFGVEEHAHAYNFRTLWQMTHDLHDNPGRIEAISASGTLDQMPGPESPRIMMKGVNRTTAKLIGRHFDKALWIVSWVNPKTEEFDLRSSDALINLGSPDNVHEIMQQMTGPYSELVNDGQEDTPIPVLYESAGAMLGRLGTKTALH